MVDGLRRWFRNAAGFLEAVSVQLLSGTIVEGGGSTTNDVAGRVNQGGRVTISFCSLQPAWEAHYSAPSSPTLDPG